MNPKKQQKKLTKALMAAELCTTREEAQKIIKKADKACNKLSGTNYGVGPT